MKVVCIIQARLGSTRLPSKVLLPLLGKPMLWWDVYRVRKSRLIDEVVIATTDQSQDNALATLCEEEGWNCYRGSENDVLDRYFQAATQYQADHIVRVTSDCPVIDPQVLDYVIAAHLSTVPAVDYTSNVNIRRYPRGLDTEVIAYAALARAWQDDASPHTREHVTPFIRQNPDKFRVLDVVQPNDYSHLRLTVDTPQDMALIEHIYEHFQQGDFSWGEVTAVLGAHPAWLELNKDVEQKSI